MKGTVIRSTGSWYLVKQEDDVMVECRLKGKMRLSDNKATNPVAVGDQVVLDFDKQEGAALIEEVLPRDNYIARQSPKHQHARHIIAANIDQAILIVTVAKPRTSSGFIDRFLVTAEAYHIPTVLLFNKQDVLEGKELKKQEELIALYRSIGYQAEIISAMTGIGIDNVKHVIKGKTSLIAGHSGVGKSTLINYLQPGLDLKTSEISGSSSKGKHATTFAEMFSLSDGYIIDTPGIKEFGILDLEPQEICHYFPEMVDLIHGCKYHNCVHNNEPDCEIKRALEAGTINEERYKNYLNILEDTLKITR